MKTPILIRVPAEDLARWDKWAAALGLTRSELIRRTVNRSCGHDPDADLKALLTAVLMRAEKERES